MSADAELFAGEEVAYGKLSSSPDCECKVEGQFSCKAERAFAIEPFRIGVGAKRFVIGFGLIGEECEWRSIEFSGEFEAGGIPFFIQMVFEDELSEVHLFGYVGK